MTWSSGSGVLSWFEWTLVGFARLLVHPWLWRLLWHRWVRAGAAWMTTLMVAAACLYFSWTFYDTPKRPEGNQGHTLIDFGGQWIMARMLVTGQGQQLYNRVVQREVIRAAYPITREEPDAPRHDVDNFMFWFMGTDDPLAAEAVASFALPFGADSPLSTVAALAMDDHLWQPGPPNPVTNALVPLSACDPLGLLLWTDFARESALRQPLAKARAPQVGGPLYPPVQALLFAPLGLLSPQSGYRVNQVLGIALAFIAGLGVRLLTRGRIWCSVATTLILLYPGFSSSLTLGQNAALTLTIVIWGWALVARGRPTSGGIIWGFLAFKPVWAATFLLVPLATRRWRFALAMLASGISLGLLTLPVVGIHSWFDWLAVGRDATLTYASDLNWTQLSRDLLTIPRRWMLDFSGPAYIRQHHVPAMVAGWGLLLLVLEVAVRLIVFRRREAEQALTNPTAAFLLLTAWLLCFHFMYYDVLLTVLPFFVLLSIPAEYVRPRFLALLLPKPADLGNNVIDYYEPRPLTAPPTAALVPNGISLLWVLNSPVLLMLAILLSIEHILPLTGFEASIQLHGFDYLGFRQPVQLSGSLHGPPWNTFCLLALWVWCAWLWVWEADHPDQKLAATSETVESDSNIAGPH